MNQTASRFSRRAAIVVGAIALSSAPGLAQTIDRAPRTYALTPAQKAEALNSTTESSGEAARGDLPINGGGRQIHGEAGVFVGTGGARGAFGTAAIPLGDNAGAVVSFENSRFGNDRRR